MSTTPTPAERAIACTATGRLSALPKWEWLVGFRGHVPGHVGFARRVDTLNGRGGWAFFNVTGWGEEDLVPDFSDAVTLQGLLVLVRRAWKGHDVEYTLLADGKCKLVVRHPQQQHGRAPAFLDCGPADVVLVAALEAAP